MSLQTLALEKLVQSGAPYDAECPIIKNVLFDVNCILLDMEYDLEKDYTNLCMLRKRILYCKLKKPNMSMYTAIRIQIEDCLFDEFYPESVEQIVWNEYFHGLYDLVIIGGKFDLTTTIILFNTIFKYYEALKVPPMLNANDPQYLIVHHLLGLFRSLRAEHAKLIIHDVPAHFQEAVDFRTRAKLAYTSARHIFESNRLLKGRYDAIVKWAI